MAKVEFEDPIASLTGSMTLLRKHFHCMASLTCSFVNSSRGAVRRLDLGVPKTFLIFWGEEEVRLLYTKRVLLVATSHFRRGNIAYRRFF